MSRSTRRQYKSLRREIYISQVRTISSATTTRAVNVFLGVVHNIVSNRPPCGQPYRSPSILRAGGLLVLEVLHTMGMQLFDVAVYAIGVGGICMAVCRGLQGQTYGMIWTFPPAPESNAADIIFGTVIGAIAGGIGIVFRRC